MRFVVDTYNKIKTSAELLEFDKLHLIISSATIGVAIYDNNVPNTRYTAFSSEKISRYLQSGIPFIAFENESFIKLKREFDCCCLIKSLDNFNEAIEIMANYEHYRNEAFKAYEKYYNIELAIKPFIRFLKA